MVTNNTRSYMYDVPLLLSLTEGFSYRFRYTERWIKEKNLKSKIKAFIVMHDFNTAKLFPIRHAVVTKVVSFGFI